MRVGAEIGIVKHRRFLPGKSCGGFREASFLASPPPAARMTESRLSDCRTPRPRLPLVLGTKGRKPREVLQSSLLGGTGTRPPAAEGRLTAR